MNTKIFHGSREEPSDYWTGEAEEIEAAQAQNQANRDEDRIDDYEDSKND